jgi:pyrimidine operon attenuation protein/uracil phosphoribosyltransferase
VTDSPDPRHKEHQAHEGPDEFSDEFSDKGSSDSSADPGTLKSGGDDSGSRRVVLDEVRIRRALMRIAHEIVESNADPSSLYLVAVPNGGVPLGRILVQNIAEICGCEPPLGILDTTLYRDDLASRGTRPRLRRTEMPSSVDERVVVLVEDVVSTGRTIRAAMDALMDFGRPRAVKVVALVDRGHRELPIKIDYVGKNIPTQPGETVVFAFPDGDDERELEVMVETCAPLDDELTGVRERGAASGDRLGGGG